MFTANVTPKLKLMKPLDSDQFEAQDYADTFSILDNQPGVALVDSYAGLSTLAASNGGWGVNQHGLMALDRHNNALWWWKCPAGTGVWTRANSVGLLKQVTQSIAVSTTATTGNGILVADSGLLTVPGGRTIKIDVNFDADNTAGDLSLGVFFLLDGSALLKEYVFRLGPGIGYSGSSRMITYYLQNLTPESTHQFKFYMRSSNGIASNGGGGVTTARYSTMVVSEE